MASVSYTTREDVKRALDSVETARNNTAVDRAIQAATPMVESLLHRRFYPWTGTRYKDWPDRANGRSWRLWLDADELISVNTLTAGGVVIAASDYFLEPVNSGPPYTRIEIDLESAAAFGAGNTHQRAIGIEGVFGHSAESEPAGAAAEALDASETGVDVTNSALIGVGAIIKADSERMIVTNKSMLDTGVNIDAGDSLTASVADVSITMSTTTNAPVADETILIDSERMLVVDVAGSVLTVKRAYDGSVLAAHNASADIYAPRTLTVARGALGTTAATHDSAAALTRHVVPGLVAELSAAEALNILLQRASGYARTIGSEDAVREVWGRGLSDIRREAYAAFGRKARTRAV